MIYSKARIKLSAYDSQILNQAVKKLKKSLENFELISIKTIPLPTKRRIYCVLRSPHVDKDSREHFEIRTHKRLLELFFNSNNQESLFSILESINLPSGVFFKVEY